MIRNEQGFTLVEILISLYILGLFVFFTIPLFSELKQHEQQQAIRLEATSWLQEKVEKICTSQSFNVQSGNEERKSKVIRKLVYHISWKCSAKQRNLYQIAVEIQWNKGKQQRRICLRTHRFVPS